jgi:hypothetical protein
MMQEDYYSVLARMIAATTEDENQLRRMVYELARQKLRRQLYLQHHHLRRPEMEDQLIQLEAAIAQIEAHAAGEVPLLSLPQRDAMNGASGDESPGTELVLHQSSIQATVLNSNLVEVLSPDTPVPVLSPAPPAPVQLHRIDSAQPLPPLMPFDHGYGPAPQSVQPQPRQWFKTQVVAAVLFGIAVFGAFDHRADFATLFGLKSIAPSVPQPAATAGGNQAAALPPPVTAPLARTPDPGFPVPSSYGVYALDGGKLTELEPLPIRVPDPRVAISGVITAPSPTTLPDGRVQFVVFRRNLMNDAPDHVTIRVVAQVMHALSFTSGKATKTSVDDAWAVRNNSYEMKVAPVEGNPEMIVIRPQNDRFSLPAGRYALALKNTAYDFTVSGTITDPAHCLERTDALDTQVYSECRQP